MDYNSLLQEAEQYVRNYFADNTNDKFVYHNRKHTESVVRAAAEIAQHYNLNEADTCIVKIATWFHDIGYLTVPPPEHETEGVRIATAFLQQHQATGSFISAVSNCIRATKMPQTPHSLLEEIVCDADLYHLGTDGFCETNKQLRQETELIKGVPISKTDWKQAAIKLLENHQYHTGYCKELLAGKKYLNLEQLKNKSMEENTARGKEKKKKKNASDDPSGNNAKAEKGIETMFRITSGNNQKLSAMADNKAHIMITVNSIMLSAILSLLMGKLGKHEHLTIPTFMMLTVSVATIIFSILATRPHLPKGNFNSDDLARKRVNLLFFGNFYRMSLEDYTTGMLAVMADKDFLYRSLIKDVYSQGIVLGRKYRLLRISYNVFMFGLIISVLAFIVATSIYVD